MKHDDTISETFLQNGTEVTITRRPRFICNLNYFRRCIVGIDVRSTEHSQGMSSEHHHRQDIPRRAVGLIYFLVAFAAIVVASVVAVSYGMDPNLLLSVPIVGCILALSCIKVYSKISGSFKVSEPSFTVESSD